MDEFGRAPMDPELFQLAVIEQPERIPSFLIIAPSSKGRRNEGTKQMPYPILRRRSSHGARAFA
jgi:hypothetical protein